MRFEELKTPCFIFDKKILEHRMKCLDAMKGEVKIDLCYAVKANPFLIKEMDPYVHSFEVCSWGELDICKKAGIDLSKVVLSGVNKEEEYIADGIDSCVGIITAESKLHFDLICRQAAKRDKKVKVLLRLSNGAQFGMDRSVLEEIISENGSCKNVEIVGIHYFTGTAKKKMEKLQKELECCSELIKELNRNYGWKAQMLEYGPGLAVPYFIDDDFEGQYDLYQTLVDFIAGQDFAYPVTLEMGRFFTASCGRYLTSVADVKVNDGIHVCIIDGGKNQLSYYGQNMALKTPIIQKAGTENTNKELPETTTKWTIFGSLCSFNDVIARNVPIEDLSVGDRLIFYETGAYSVTEGMAMFLSRDLAYIYEAGENGEYKLIRDRIKTSSFNYEE